MRSADWIAKRLLKENDTIFGVTGGCIVNCVDGFYKQGLRIIPVHHEQSAAMAADAYARMTGKLGLCFATSGPGGQNLMTGLACAHYDSTPVLGIIGQVPSSQYLTTQRIAGLRQYGFQESPNGRIATPITKSSRTVCASEDLQWVVDDACCEAMEDRRGACVVEICDDLQRCEVSSDYRMPGEPVGLLEGDPRILECAIEEALQKSKRPLLILGQGIDIAGQREKVDALVSGLKIPVLLTWGAKDLLGEDNPYYIGGFGIAAERTGNYALLHADTLICLGTRMDTHCFGSKQAFLRDKTIVVCDIDYAELEKIEGGNVTRVIYNLRAGLPQVPSFDSSRWSKWLEALMTVRSRYQITNFGDPDTSDGWNPYQLMSRLSRACTEDAILCVDAGQTLTWACQAWMTKRGQRIFSDFNNSCMGYALPGAIGAAFACKDRPVYSIIGDGSLMMNLQDIQTIAHHNLNIRICVIDNGGYGMIRQTQGDWPSLSPDVSCNHESGLTFPSYRRISVAFDLPYVDVRTDADINRVVRSNGPMFVQCHIRPGSKIEPKLLVTDQLWNQKPYLSDEEVAWINATLSV